MSGPWVEDETAAPLHAVPLRRVDEHPDWCDPEWCTAGRSHGQHHSSVVRYGPGGMFAAWLEGGAGRIPEVVISIPGVGASRHLNAAALAAAYPTVIPLLLAQAGVNIPDGDETVE